MAVIHSPFYGPYRVRQPGWYLGRGYKDGFLCIMISISKHSLESHEVGNSARGLPSNSRLLANSGVGISLGDPLNFKLLVVSSFHFGICFSFLWALRRRRKKTHTSAAMRIRPPALAPTPMPAAAPVDRPVDFVSDWVFGFSSFVPGAGVADVPDAVDVAVFEVEVAALVDVALALGVDEEIFVANSACRNFTVSPFVAFGLLRHPDSRVSMTEQVVG